MKGSCLEKHPAPHAKFAESRATLTTFAPSIITGFESMGTSTAPGAARTIGARKMFTLYGASGNTKTVPEGVKLFGTTFGGFYRTLATRHHQATFCGDTSTHKSGGRTIIIGQKTASGALSTTEKTALLLPKSGGSATQSLSKTTNYGNRLASASSGFSNYWTNKAADVQYAKGQSLSTSSTRLTIATTLGQFAAFFVLGATSRLAVLATALTRYAPQLTISNERNLGAVWFRGEGAASPLSVGGA